MNFFTKYPNLKKKKIFNGWGGGQGEVCGWERGAEVSEFFFTMNPN